MSAGVTLLVYPDGTKRTVPIGAEWERLISLGWQPCPDRPPWMIANEEQYLARLTARTERRAR